MIVDYSQPISCSALLDVFPIPMMDELRAQISRYSVCAALDLRDVYHRIAARGDERYHNTLEVCGINSNAYNFDLLTALHGCKVLSTKLCLKRNRMASSNTQIPLRSVVPPRKIMTKTPRRSLLLLQNMVLYLENDKNSGCHEYESSTL